MVVEGAKLLEETTDEKRWLKHNPFYYYISHYLICVNLGRHLILPNYEFRYKE